MIKDILDMSMFVRACVRACMRGVCCQYLYSCTFNFDLLALERARGVVQEGGGGGLACRSKLHRTAT